MIMPQKSDESIAAMMPAGEVLLDESDNTIYRFSVKDRKGGEVSLKDYAGKVLLVVNTATRCGFTPQYEGLEAMYERLRDDGFELLDFPCNQFGQQAPGTDEEIHSFCVLNYKTAFPQFAKVEVNGASDLDFTRISCRDFIVRVNGAADIDAMGIDVASVDIQVNGAGDVELSGKAGKADLNVSGAGDIDATGLTVAGEVKKHAAGIAKIRI